MRSNVSFRGSRINDWRLPLSWLGNALLCVACNTAGTDSEGSGEKAKPGDDEQAESSNSNTEADEAIVTEPVQIQDFCSSLTLAHCEAAVNCCSDPERAYSGLTDCVASYEAPCDLGYAVGTSNETWEDARFDPEAAGRELAKYKRSAAECTLPYEVNFSAVFEAGAFQVECVSDLQCPAGAVCDVGCHFGNIDDGVLCQATEQCGDQSHCRAEQHMFFADDDGDSETPSTNDDEDPTMLDWDFIPRICVSGKRVKGSRCIRAECPRGFYCEGSVPDGQSPFGWSEGVCAKPAENGATCLLRSDCASRFCSTPSYEWDWVYAEQDGMLTATPPESGTCLPCGPDDCGDFACVEGVCDPTAYRRDKKDGASCDTGIECVSGWCVAGICITPDGNDLYCPN